MSTINVFQISFEIWGCIISIIICILLGNISFEKNDMIGKKLWRMILINNFLLVSDALAYIYRGDLTHIGFLMTRICNFLVFVFEYIILSIFVSYVKDITSYNEENPATWLKYLTFIILAVGFTGLVITQFTGLYYSFDDTNHYQRGNGIWISFAVCGAVLFICFFRLWLHRKVFSKTGTSICLLCSMIFFVCIAAQFIFYGLSFINIGITIVLILMYLSHYKIQYEMYINNSIEEAVSDTRALLEWKSVSDCAEQTQEVHNEENKK